MAEHQSAICYVLAILGPIFFMSMQVSFFQTAMKIVRKKSDLRLSPLPFISLLTNCAVMSLYAYLRSNATIFCPNFTGFVTGLVCIVVYQQYTRETKKEFFFAAAFILLVAFYFALTGAAYSLGLVGVFLSVVLMGSPLATLNTVIAEKSTDSLPFMTSVTTFLNALTWSLYGVMEVNDEIVYIPNMIGLFLATVQLSCFCVYGMPTDTPDESRYTAVQIPNTENTSEGLQIPLVQNDKSKLQSYA